jgi:ABC-type uncharacterized transport system substrate-binding protein
VLIPGASDDREFQAHLTAFLQGLQELATIVVLSDVASRSRTFSAMCTSVPIVFTTSDDPVRLGLVTSLSQPGGNLTGANVIREQT